ncbi:MAG TPA: hypothetical protein VE093_45840 [Polyangiaceae bacterium]|jgi:hypothetical protein|nr:hypothetical protein [Polyangiaceae bacterium]
MKRRILLAFALGLSASSLIAACGLDAADGPDEPIDSTAQAVTAAGPVPSGLPSRVMVGLFEDTGATWMKTSGVPWDARYRYFTKGWVNNWGWSAYDGSWGLNYLQECDTQGYVPAVQFYQMNGEPGGGEPEFLQKAQNAPTMASYFNDFKILMQRVKDFGKPALILLEADGYGYMEQQSGENPNAYAAVAATGLPELAGLPNTVAGWGMAFLQIRKAVGASNALLGIHISGWASGKDIAHFSVADPIQPEVDKVYSFLAPLGLGPNATGETYDVLVGDPLDRDADFYQITQGQNRWWDPSDNASVSSKSFNRYAEWLRLWNVKASKRWVLWQIPLGNSNHLNVYNNGAPREGYKDNRPEYFFSSGTAHVSKFAESGVIALLFGAGTGGQSSYGNDIYTDGQSFMKSRVLSFYQAGGVPLGSGPAPDAGTDAGADAGADSGADASAPSSDTSQYNFESGAQSWVSSGGMITGVASSTAKAFAGTRSLAVTFNGGAGDKRRVYVASPSVAAGKTITFRIWVPAGSTITSVQPYALQGATGNWAWTGNWQGIGSMSPGSWKSLTLTVPATAKTPLAELGVEFATNGAWSGTCYIDAISW